MELGKSDAGCILHDYYCVSGGLLSMGHRYWVARLGIDSLLSRALARRIRIGLFPDWLVEKGQVAVERRILVVHSPLIQQPTPQDNTESTAS